MHETTLTYEEALVRRAVGCYWRRSLGIGYWVALAMTEVERHQGTVEVR